MSKIVYTVQTGTSLVALNPASKFIAIFLAFTFGVITVVGIIGLFRNVNDLLRISKEPYEISFYHILISSYQMDPELLNENETKFTGKEMVRDYKNSELKKYLSGNYKTILTNAFFVLVSVLSYIFFISL